MSDQSRLESEGASPAESGALSMLTSAGTLASDGRLSALA
jgi:hypothetical protein